jgi:hypothetical protein
VLAAGYDSGRSEERESVMAKGEKPAYKVLVSRQNEDKTETYYTEIGSAWNVAKDGISIQFNALPVDGRCVLFPRKDDE